MMIRFTERRRLFSVKKHTIPFKWIMLAAIAVIFLAIYFFLRNFLHL
ncbi:MAG: hypothetical protein N2201_04340 [candidate division WOR-3 bacterium]|nr:hypothetical protein [candidate division WOR-3 bacterium]